LPAKQLVRAFETILTDIRGALFGQTFFSVPFAGLDDPTQNGHSQFVVIPLLRSNLIRRSF
jgi:hypothetical protein